MHVLATAGHVDHGKSTLVRALTGMEPDRWAEERRRGMTIDLGFAWTTTPERETVAFVDVPGHERFVPNMLAGVGPVPAALMIVAADEGWMPQSAEHLAALDALQVRHGLLVITRADLAPPAAALAEARARLSRTTLADVEAVAVSAPTGAGLDELRAAIDRLVRNLPVPDSESAVRLWIDRAFTIKGAGTVVTGTLGAGVIRVGDEFRLGGETVRVRGLQTLGVTQSEVAAVSRVAINLRGIDKERAARGNALLTPGMFRATDLIDVRIDGDPAKDLPASLTLHIGSAAVPARVRPLGPDTARLRLSHPLPLRLGDRALLRDPGRRHIAGGVTVLDVTPPGLSRRGAAAARAAELATESGTPNLSAELRRRLLLKRGDLTTMGVPIDREPVAGEWFADPGHWASLAERLPGEVARYKAEHPLEPGIPLEALRHRMELPDRALVEALVKPPLTIRSGRVTTAAAQGIPPELTQAIDRAFAGRSPFAAPEAHDLAAHGLGARQLAAAVRAGLLVQLAPNVVLRADAPAQAAGKLREIPQPFTLSEARKALDTTRRVAVPLLEFLDRKGLTTRQEDDRRVTAPGREPVPGP